MQQPRILHADIVPGRIVEPRQLDAGRFIGQLFKIIGTHVPPPAGVKSPALWASEARVNELFASHDVKIERQRFQFRYESADHLLEVFKTYYGPTNRPLLRSMRPSKRRCRATCSGSSGA
jgi:hypothetical protein